MFARVINLFFIRLVWFAVHILTAIHLSNPSSADEVFVTNDRELKSALVHLVPGTTIKIAAGDYSGGNRLVGTKGLTIEAMDPLSPPRFLGGNVAWHISNCEAFTMRHLRISGQKNNGINVDDGGHREMSTQNILIEKIEIEDIGPQGNHDGIKASGIRNLTIRHCKISGWGGQGIDLVGCHQSTITGCQLFGKEGFSASAGIQMKGGTSEVTVEGCRLVRAGERPINVGGSTGIDYFRPPAAKYEAAKIVVRNNVIEGGICASAFVGVDGAEYFDNTILYPEKWVFRILQENRESGFVPCRNVVVSNNQITFRRSQIQTECNIGSGTDASSFEFRNNRWLADDHPEASRPKLPSEEQNGKYGLPKTGQVDPSRNE